MYTRSDILEFLQLTPEPTGSSEAPRYEQSEDLSEGQFDEQALIHEKSARSYKPVLTAQPGATRPKVIICGDLFLGRPLERAEIFILRGLFEFCDVYRLPDKEPWVPLHGIEQLLASFDALPNAIQKEAARHLPLGYAAKDYVIIDHNEYVTRRNAFFAGKTLLEDFKTGLPPLPSLLDLTWDNDFISHLNRFTSTLSGYTRMRIHASRFLLPMALPGFLDLIPTIQEIEVEGAASQWVKQVLPYFTNKHIILKNPIITEAFQVTPKFMITGLTIEYDEASTHALQQLEINSARLETLVLRQCDQLVSLQLTAPCLNAIELDTLKRLVGKVDLCESPSPTSIKVKNCQPHMGFLFEPNFFDRIKVIEVEGFLKPGCTLSAVEVATIRVHDVSELNQFLSSAQQLKELNVEIDHMDQDIYIKHPTLTRLTISHCHGHRFCLLHIANTPLQRLTLTEAMISQLDLGGIDQSISLSLNNNVLYQYVAPPSGLHALQIMRVLPLRYPDEQQVLLAMLTDTLEELDLSLPTLPTEDFLQNLRRLKKLVLSNLRFQKHKIFIGHNEALTQIKITMVGYKNHSIDNLTFANLPQLNRLTIEDVGSIHDNPKGIAMLSIMSCPNLKKLGLAAKIQIHLHDHPETLSVMELAHARGPIYQDAVNLERLNLQSCVAAVVNKIETLDLAQMRRLRVLAVFEMNSGGAAFAIKNISKELRAFMFCDYGARRVMVDLSSLKKLELLFEDFLADYTLHPSARLLALSETSGSGGNENVLAAWFVEHKNNVSSLLDLSLNDEIFWRLLPPKLLRLALGGTNNMAELLAQCPQLLALKLGYWGGTHRTPAYMKYSNIKQIELEKEDKNNNKLNAVIKNALPCLVKFDFPKPKPTIEEEKLILQASSSEMLQHNHTSQVACFDLEESDQVDGDTMDGQSYVATGAFIAELYAQEKIDKNHYRIHVSDAVKDKKGQITFSFQPKSSHLTHYKVAMSTWTEDAVNQLGQVTRRTADAVMGFIKGKLQPGKYYPLVSVNPSAKQDLKTVLSSSSDIELHWDKHHQQYYVALKKNIKTPKDMTLTYQLANAIPKQLGQLAKFKPAKLLPASLLVRQKQIAAILPDLFKKEIPLENRLKMLEEHCRIHTTAGKLTNPGKTDFDRILATLSEKKGVCRHRSRAFMIVARMMGVRVKMIGNEKHQFCEVCYEHGWQRVDLGGGRLHDLTPAAARQSHLNRLVAPMTSSYPVRRTPPSPSHKFYLHFKDLANQSRITQINDLFQRHQGLMPLLHLQDKDDPCVVNQHILQALQEQKEDTLYQHLYIHSPRDFKTYFKPYCVSTEGQLIEKPDGGPLLNLIQNGGALVINWATFNPTEIAHYKSILDTLPTLFGEPVSPKLHIINLASPKTQACSAFSSRCKSYSLARPLAFCHSRLRGNDKGGKSGKDESHPDVLEVDLFQRPAWRELLLGQIEFAGQQIFLPKSNKLFDAIQQGKHLLIHNPPDDSEFKLFLYRLQVEKKFLYNGNLFPVPDHFQTETRKTTRSMESSQIAVKFAQQHDDKPLSIDAAVPVIGMHNWHLCFRQIEIDPEKRTARTIPGLLAEHRKFYITGNIFMSDWQYLVDVVKKHYSGQAFEFVLLPGAQIIKYSAHPETPASSPVSLEKNSSSPRKRGSPDIDEGIPASAGMTVPIFKSNDPDLLTEQLASECKETPIIIDVSAQTTFRDLLCEVKFIDKKTSENANPVGFSYHEQGLLTALREGRTVILNGELSPALAQHLAPLLQLAPHIHLNGKTIRFKDTAKLISVQPMQGATFPFACATREYDWADYHKLFSNHAAQLDLIQKFFEFAEKLPRHRLENVKQPLTKSAARIQEFINHLQHPEVHPRNPIKGIFLYDYPKESDDYAYLNVVAKCLFAPDNQSPVRSHKLKKLIKQYNVITRNDLDHAPIWKLLNCFSGADLKKMLDGQSLQNYITEGDFPTVDPTIKMALWNAIQASAPKMHSIDSHAKRMRELEGFLQDQSHPILFLKGKPGIGKTYAMTLLEEKHRHSSRPYAVFEDNIEAWLMASGVDQIPVLVLDEANLSPDGTWNFLKGLTRLNAKGNPVVFYKEKEYELTPAHKVVLTGNPEEYPGRHYHALIQQYAETIYLTEPHREFLFHQVLRKILPAEYYHPTLLNAMLDACQLIKKHKKHLVLSIRDVENLAHRLTCIEDKKMDIAESTFRACVSEFAGVLPSEKHRQHFIRDLRACFQQNTLTVPEEKPVTGPDLITVHEDHYLTQEKKYLLDAIEQDLQLRELAIKKQGQLSYKRGILIEGESGIGKSTLFQAVLEAKGFKNDKEATDPTKRYYLITAGSANVYETLIKAYREGSVVILDELNLDTDLEKLLNQLLSGKDPDLKYQDKKPVPGFTLFASQNPSNYLGREASSIALVNRLHYMKMDMFTTKELIALTHKNLVEGYQKAQQEHEKQLNTRSILTFLNTNLKKLNALTDQPFKPEEAKTLCDIHENIGDQRFYGKLEHAHKNRRLKNSGALFMLGNHYEKSSQNLQEAVVCWREAAAKGYDAAKQKLASYDNDFIGYFAAEKLADLGFHHSFDREALLNAVAAPFQQTKNPEITQEQKDHLLHFIQANKTASDEKLIAAMAMISYVVNLSVNQKPIVIDVEKISKHSKVKIIAKQEFAEWIQAWNAFAQSRDRQGASPRIIQRPNTP